jgi:GH24 family phage-related lysozyme (muramidase)
MHHVTEAGLNLTKRLEGFSSTVYICPAGYPTMGYSHVVLSAPLADMKIESGSWGKPEQGDVPPS